MTSTIKINVALHTSREHILDMISDRGFNIDKYRNYTKQDIYNMLSNYDKQKDIAEQNPLDIIASNDKKEKIYVKYFLDEFKQKKITELINSIYEKKILCEKDTLILIVNNEVLISKNDKVSEYITKLHKNKKYVQIFGIPNLMYNPSKHIKMPKHRIMSKKKLIEVMKTYNMKLENFPIIKRDDPMAKYLGMRENDVCEIIRPNRSGGFEPYYRICKK